MESDGETDKKAGDDLKDSGISKTYLESALGDKGGAYNNSKQRRLAALTKPKKLTAHLFMGRHLVAQKKWKRSVAGSSAEIERCP